MQDRYVGDIGDFARSGMLRELFGKPEAVESVKSPLRLGVVWCLNESGQVGNLTPNTYQNLRYLDPCLFGKLNRLVQKGKRRLSEFECNKILNTQLYFPEPLSGLSITERKEWVNNAIEKIKDAEVIFIDPDTGIDTETTPRLSPEHIFIDELKQFYDKGKSLIIYQHIGQGMPAGYKAKEYINELSERLRNALHPHTVWALRWRRRQGRVFFVVVHTDQGGDLNQLVQAFIKKPNWFVRQPGFPHPHFENVS